ncbi:MAG: hypothetical protein QXY40_10590 [Candidatus Methanomethylicia archaeon]
MDRFKHWSFKGVWTNLFKTLIDRRYSMDSLDRVSVDSITIRAREDRG